MEKSNKPTYFLYTHTDAEGNIFYVGKGTKNNNRKDGYSRAYSKALKRKEWMEIACKGYTVSIIEESEDENYILLRENEFALYCKDCVNKTFLNKYKVYSVNRISDDQAEIDFWGRKFYIFSNGLIKNDKGRTMKV